jgi:hypothetical protein
MQSLERRVCALESQVTTINANVFIVPVMAGETSEQAIKRAGYEPDAPGIFFVCLVAMAREGPQVR